MVVWKNNQYGSGCYAKVGWFEININWNMNKPEGENNYFILVNGRRAKKTFEEVADAKKYATSWLKRMCNETLEEINKDNNNEKI